jgi:ankyrin repeat protein
MVKSYVGQSHGNIKGVKELVAKEPRLVNAAWDWQGGDWETGLGAASHVGNRDIANFLLDNGARIDVYAMAMLGQTELVKAILKTYPKTHAVPGPHGIPLISHAIYGRDPADDVFALLLAAGADVNQPTYGGMTPLMSAASVGRVEIVQQLLDHKSDPSLKDNKGKTALDHARNRKREKVVAILEKLTP